MKRKALIGIILLGQAVGGVLLLYGGYWFYWCIKAAGGPSLGGSWIGESVLGAFILSLLLTGTGAFLYLMYLVADTIASCSKRVKEK